MTPFTDPSGPEMRPARGASVVALFDGQCGVCTRSAAWVAARDVRGRVERLDLREPVAAARFIAFQPEKVREALHVVDSTGQIWVGVDALGRLLGELPGWRRAGRWMVAPALRGVTGAAYAWFASRRLSFNRFFPLAEKGCDGTCSHDGLGVAGPPAPGAAGAKGFVTPFVDGRRFLDRAAPGGPAAPTPPSSPDTPR